MIVFIKKNKFVKKTRENIMYCNLCKAHYREFVDNNKLLEVPLDKDNSIYICLVCYANMLEKILEEQSNKI